MDYTDYYYDQTPYKSLQEALKLARNAVQGEREDELFYDYLISNAPSEEEKDIIKSIRDDEIKHNKMFREIYTYYTGEELPKAKDTEFTKPDTYLEGVKKAFFGELSAMERYRIIRAGLPSKYYRDMVFEILTDEMKHADKYNYILNLHSEDMRPAKSMMRPTNMQRDRENTDRNQNQMPGNEENMTLDDLLEYIEPVVNEALAEAKAGTDLKYLFQKYILIGIMIGNGYSIEEGVEEVRAWSYNS